MAEPISQQNVTGAMKEIVRELGEYTKKNGQAKVDEFPKMELAAKYDRFSFWNNSFYLRLPP